MQYFRGKMMIVQKASQRKTGAQTSAKKWSKAIVHPTNCLVTNLPFHHLPTSMKKKTFQKTSISVKHNKKHQPFPWSCYEFWFPFPQPSFRRRSRACPSDAAATGCAPKSLKSSESCEHFNSRSTFSRRSCGFFATFMGFWCVFFEFYGIVMGCECDMKMGVNWDLNEFWWDFKGYLWILIGFYGMSVGYEKDFHEMFMEFSITVLPHRSSHQQRRIRSWGRHGWGNFNGFQTIWSTWIQVPKAGVSGTRVPSSWSSWTGKKKGQKRAPAILVRTIPEVSKATSHHSCCWKQRKKMGVLWGTQQI